MYLVRESQNPYDRNAIKVTTINHQQVGHISAGSSFPNIAACQAPILDYMLDPTQPRVVGAEAEAISLEGTGSKYSSWCIITLVGSPDHGGIIARHLNSCHLPYLDMVTNQSYNGYYDPPLKRPMEISFDATTEDRVNLCQDSALTGEEEVLILENADNIGSVNRTIMEQESFSLFMKTA